ncbi:MAG TPA: TlpA disulfide reductase family protein [Longimicrobiales bacterium]|nr:TlpA disulfide reductase family protein [Longimicrobiales bacterium]
MLTRTMAHRITLAAAVLVLGACAAPPDVVVQGSRVPDYGARDLAGQQVSLRDMRGEVVLLNIWATWCYPCRKEMPGLEDLHRELEASGLNVLAVSVDAAGAAPEIHEFLGELGLTMKVLHDSRADISRVFSTRGVPETFLIGHDGVLRHHWIGRIDAHSESVRGPVIAALRDMHATLASADGDTR